MECSSFLITAKLLYSFIKQNFTWMFVLLCCHLQFRKYVDEPKCAMENKCKANVFFANVFNGLKDFLCSSPSV